MYQGAILPSQFCLYFVRRNERNIEEKQKLPKNSVCDGIEHITFQTVRTYVSFHKDIQWPDQRFCLLLSEAQIKRCVELAKRILDPPNRFCGRSRKIKI